MAKEFNLSPQTQFKQKIQKDESVRIELTLSKEQMEILDRAKGAVIPHPAWGHIC
ncbi:MAG: hypothetical protein IPK04_04020 [Bdellovibrionales bacterium]|nr:hypothetical protein [Bdellovibrionales bacterium]